MSSHNNTNLYSPLEAGEIRLLVLLPGPRNQPIQCRLATVKLQNQDEIPVYHALSYMWGPPPPTMLILVNDNPFEVRENLFEALKQLRNEYFPRCLWVDAICINQKDNAERGHQVAIMSSVFRAATKVLVWLGEAEDDSDMAFEALASVHGHLGLLQKMAKSWVMAGVDDSGYPSSLDQVEAAILSICNRPYWRRLWIIQEILSASSIEVLCGSKVLSWGEFWTGLQCIGNINIRSPLDAAGACVSTAAYRIAHKSSQQCQSYTMEELLDLCLTCDSQCEDIRDRIYGLLSLCKDLQIEPDYSKSATELYLDVIQAHYSKTHTSLREKTIPDLNSRFACPFILTTKDLLGDPFWDHEHERYLMAEISSPSLLSEKYNDMSMEIEMYAVTEIRKIGPVVSKETPYWASSSYFTYPGWKSLSIEGDFLWGRSQAQRIRQIHRLAAFQGLCFSQDPRDLTFAQDKSKTSWGLPDSNGDYRLFYDNAFIYGMSSVNIKIGDILCYAPCFGWFVVRFVREGKSFILLGRAFPHYPLYIIKNKAIGKQAWVLVLCSAC